MQLISKKSQDTYDIGFTIGHLLLEPTNIYLIGEMGVGKTAFSQGVLRGMGIVDKYLTSPTYTIVNTYELSGKNVHHFDIYRIEDYDELSYIGFDEYMDGRDSVIVEWADLIREHLPHRGIWIYIKSNQGDIRNINIQGVDISFDNILEKLKKWEDVN